MTGQWACEAYGPEGLEVGALCFLSPEPGKRVCGSRDECSQTMAAERGRVFRRINELAAGGDEAAGYLEQQFSRPGQLLGGGEDQEQDGDPEATS